MGKTARLSSAYPSLGAKRERGEVVDHPSVSGSVILFIVKKQQQACLYRLLRHMIQQADKPDGMLPQICWICWISHIHLGWSPKKCFLKGETLSKNKETKNLESRGISFHHCKLTELVTAQYFFWIIGRQSTQTAMYQSQSGVEWSLF